jgi:hypothetical protein
VATELVSRRPESWTSGLSTVGEFPEDEHALGTSMSSGRDAGRREHLAERGAGGRKVDMLNGRRYVICVW